MFAPFRRTAMLTRDHKAAESNHVWMDAGVPLLDRFLKSHPHPAWGASGLHRALPAFIAHFVEWPDQILKSRKGYCRHKEWIDALFMSGAPLFEIGPGQDIDAPLGHIQPLAARAIRFALPPIDPAGTRYPRVTITLIAEDGPGDAIDHLHVGLRGNVLGNLLAQPGRYGRGRVRRWFNVDARPLMRSATNGETVLTISNVAPDAVRSKPLKVRLHVAVRHPRPLAWRQR